MSRLPSSSGASGVSDLQRRDPAVATETLKTQAAFSSEDSTVNPFIAIFIVNPFVSDFTNYRVVQFAIRKTVVGELAFLSIALPLDFPLVLEYKFLIYE